MKVNIVGRNVGITDRFREYVTEKSDRVDHLAERAQSFDIKVSRHNEKPNGGSGEDRVELTVVGKGPLVRAEAAAGDKYAAFDLAMDKLCERMRRAKDKKKVHRGKHKPISLAEASATGFRDMGVVPAAPEVIVSVSTGSVPVISDAAAGETEEDYSPVVIRRKVFEAEWLTVDDAVDRMELVGHDFFLFIDSETSRPSVVYRRKGWDYGVIGLDGAEEAVPAAVPQRA